MWKALRGRALGKLEGTDQGDGSTSQGERHKGDSSAQLSEGAADTWILDFQPPGSWDNALPLFKPPSPWYLVMVTCGKECTRRRLFWGGHQTSAGSTQVTTLAGATFDAGGCSLSGGAWSWSRCHHFCCHEGESFQEQKPQRESIAERCGQRNWALRRCLRTWI